MKKRIGTFMTAAFVAAAMAFSSQAEAQLVISQVYGGGGNAGATYTHDFVELFNPTASTVNFTDWSVQYASAAGNFNGATVISGSIPAGGYFLVQMAAGTGGTTALPTPDAIGSLALGASNGKVLLYAGTDPLTTNPAPDSDPNIIDYVGFGTASTFLGTGPAPAPGNTTAILRGAAGCANTLNNAVDFSTGAPDPRNSSSPINDCTSVSAQFLRAYSVAPDVVRVEFDVEPASATVSDFTLSDSQSATITGITPVTATSYNLQLSAAQTDTTPDSVTYVPDSTSMGFIGGITDLLNFRNGSIGTGQLITVDVTVTAISGNNIAAQATSGAPAGRGIFFFSGGLAGSVNVDDEIRVAGTTFQFTAGASLRNQLENPILISSVPGTPIVPTVVPVTDFLSTNAAGSNPAEQYEGVLITVNNVTYVEELTFGERGFNGPGGATEPFMTVPTFFPAAAVNYLLGNTYNLTGIGFESFGFYKLAVRSLDDVDGVLNVEDWLLY